MIRQLRSVAASVALVSITTSARADVSPDDRARAQQLFESALADAEAGRYGTACPMFAASQQADPKTSTLLNLGRCYESLGRTASAWAAFREAEALARKVGRADLEATARSLAEAIAARLVRLTIVVPVGARAPDLVVSRDGRRLTDAEWSMGIPVDEGEHEIAAEAPGRETWRTRVVVRGASRSVEVPPLAVASSPSPPASVAPGTPDGSSLATPRAWWTPMRATGVAVAGAGAATTLVGLGLALVAKSNYDDARGQCSAVDDCPSNAVRSGESARSLANAATVVMVSGGVIALAGAALFVFAPRPSSRGDAARGAPVRARVAVGPGALGVIGEW